MKLDSRIRKELTRRANGDRRAVAMWRAYVRFLEGCLVLKEHAPGTAVHHILWRAEYPRYIKSKWNLIRLTHEDHTAAAALALAAEPHNENLRQGFTATLRMSGTNQHLAWKPKNPKEVIRLYLSGQSREQLGKRFGVSGWTVCKFLRRVSVPIRTIGEAQKWRPKNIQEIVDMRQKEKMSVETIAKKCGVCRVTIRRLLMEQGVTRLKIIGRPPWEPKNPQKAINLYKRGYSVKELAPKYKVSWLTFLKFLRRSGVQIRKQGETQRLQYLSGRRSWVNQFISKPQFLRSGKKAA